MRHFTMVLAVSSLLVSGPALAQSARAPGGFYVGGSIGTAVLWDTETEVNQNDFDTEYDTFGFAVAGQVGYFLNDNIRFEGELAYQSADGEIDFADNDLELSLIRGSISAYYDFDPVALAGVSSLRPYVGGGIGLVNIDLEADGLRGEEDSTELTFQGEVGTSYDLSPNFALVPAFRLEYTGESEDLESTIVSLFKIGIRVAL